MISTILHPIFEVETYAESAQFAQAFFHRPKIFLGGLSFASVFHKLFQLRFVVQQFEKNFECRFDNFREPATIVCEL